jgi:hypothetical protein
LIAKFAKFSGNVAILFYLHDLTGFENLLGLILSHEATKQIKNDSDGYPIFTAKLKPKQIQ